MRVLALPCLRGIRKKLFECLLYSTITELGAAEVTVIIIFVLFKNMQQSFRELGPNIAREVHIRTERHLNDPRHEAPNDRR